MSARRGRLSSRPMTLSRAQILAALDYYLKHADRDLPPDVVARLAELYRVTSVEDIAARVPLAVALFEETLAALDAPA